MKKINVAVLCQNDVFVLPKNVKLLFQINEINIKTIVNIDHKGSLENKKLLFFRGFGFYQSLKLALLSTSYKFLNLIDYLLFFKLNFQKSIQSIAAVNSSTYMVIDDPNKKIFIDWLKKNEIDLIISFSAPCIFKSELLEIPKLGCINLHCSLLPKYAGLLPSFWTLYHDEKKIGATVHYMDTKIDNGPILDQVEINNIGKPSMFSVINATKKAGGILMVNSVKKIINGNLTVKPNNAEESQYYTWPTLNEIKKFRSKGGKLI